MSLVKRCSLGIIVFLAYIGVSTPYPILPILFLHGNNDFLPKDAIVSFRTIMLGITLAIYPFGQLIGNVILGYLSDFINRKFLLCSTLLLAGCGYFFSGYSIKLHSITLLVASRFFTGLFEGNVTIVQSLIVTKNSNVTTIKNFSWIFMCCTLGFIVGPFIGSVFSMKSIVPWFSYSTPFYIIGLFTCLATLLVLFFIKNPLKPNQKTKAPSLKRDLINIPLFLKIFTISLIGFFCIDLIFIFSPIYFVQKWNVSTILLSYFNAGLSLFLALIQGILLPFLSIRIRSSTMVLLSLMLFPIVLTIMLLLNRYYLVFIIIPFIAFAIASFTTNINVLVTKFIPAQYMGRVIGLMRSTRAFGDTLACIFAGMLAGFAPELSLVMVIGLFLFTFVFYFFKIRIMLTTNKI